MSNYFHAKVRFLRQMDNGLIKQIKEEYLVDAMSFTECEARVLQEVGEGMREVTIDAITKSPINEVLPVGDSDLWFKCKVTYSVTDEETEKEKKVTTYLLINASDAKEAYERCQEHLKDMLVPFEIPDVRETKIIEVYDYQKQAPKGFVKVNITDIAGHANEPDYDSDEYRDNMRKAEDELNFDDDDEREEDCAMEGDAVESRVHPTFNPILDSIKGGKFFLSQNEPLPTEKPAFQTIAFDPTNGQAVGFDMPDDLLAILDEEGLNLKVGQLQRITEQAEALPHDEFISWIGVTFDIGSRASAEIWEVLND